MFKKFTKYVINEINIKLKNPVIAEINEIEKGSFPEKILEIKIQAVKKRIKFKKINIPKGTDSVIISIIKPLKKANQKPTLCPLVANIITITGVEM